MVELKRDNVIGLWVMFAFWTIFFLAFMVYPAYACINSPYFKKFLDAFIFWELFVLFIYAFFVLRATLIRVPMSIEKIGDDLFRLHTVLTKYDFHRKGISVLYSETIKIDLYSTKLKIRREDFIDKTPEQNFWEDLLKKFD